MAFIYMNNAEMKLRVRPDTPRKAERLKIVRTEMRFQDDALSCHALCLCYPLGAQLAWVRIAAERRKIGRFSNFFGEHRVHVDDVEGICLLRP